MLPAGGGQADGEAELRALMPPVLCQGPGAICVISPRSRGEMADCAHLHSARRAAAASLSPQRAVLADGSGSSSW